MVLSAFLSDLYSSITPSEVHAEAPQGGNKDGDKSESGSEKPQNSSEDKEGDKEEEEEEPAEKEGEEEEEEEPEDPKPKLEEECANSKECSSVKHHYDHCVERVTKQIDEDGKANEDCVEEFFHLAHCASNCAAPKLWKILK